MQYGFTESFISPITFSQRVMWGSGQGHSTPLPISRGGKSRSACTSRFNPTKLEVQMKLNGTTLSRQFRMSVSLSMCLCVFVTLKNQSGPRLLARPFLCLVPVHLSLVFTLKCKERVKRTVLIGLLGLTSNSLPYSVVWSHPAVIDLFL